MGDFVPPGAEPTTRTHSICESVHASSRSPWHIRPNTGPLKLGGGIDTPSLCGLVKSGWDIGPPAVEDVAHADFMCPACVAAWRHALPSCPHRTKGTDE